MAYPTRYLLTLVALLMITLAGCTSQQLEAYKQQISELNEQVKVLNERKEQALAGADAISAALDEQLTAAREQANALPDGPDKTKALAVIDKMASEKDRVQAVADEYVGKVDAELASITASIDRLNTALADADTPAGAFGVTANEVGTHLPPPWNLIAYGIAGLALAVQERQRQKAKQGLRGLVESIETVKRENNGVLDFNRGLTKTQLRAAMPTSTREAVDAERARMAKKDPTSRVIVTNAAKPD